MATERATDAASRPAARARAATPAPGGGARFAGWPKAVYDFFDGLEEDNSRDWFVAHRDAYERDVRAPMQALLALGGRELGAEPHLFRPNRDVRFAKDKRPYKEQIGGVLHTPSGGLYYVQVDGGGIFVAAGYYQMAPDQVARYREAVAGADGEDLAALLADAARGGLSCGEPQLQRVPRPYEKDHPRADLLRHKSITIGRRWDQPAWLHTAACAKKVLDTWRAAVPLNAWLDRCVGPTRLPAPAPPGGR